MNEDNSVDLLLNAQKARGHVVAGCRVNLLKAIEGLVAIGAKDDYAGSLRAILLAYPEGTALPQLREVFGDTEALTKARKALRENGEIIEVKEGASVIIRPMRMPATPGTESTLGATTASALT